MLNKKYEGRLKSILILATVVFLILFVRMAYLQLFRGDYYNKQAEGNRTRETKIVAPRGLLLDRKGRRIVDSAPGFALSLKRGFKYNEDMVAILSGITHITEEQIRNRIKNAGAGYEAIRIKSNLSQEELVQFEERRKDLPGVSLEMQPLRRYINNELAVHALGYVGEVSEYDIENGRFKGMAPGSIVGKTGVEKAYDDILRGEDGKIFEEVDASGKVIQALNTVYPIAGKDLVLTIDLDLQETLEKAVDEGLKSYRDSGWAPNAYAAAIVAIDPNTGAIRAMVSRPAFNPNLFVKGISDKD